MKVNNKDYVRGYRDGYRDAQNDMPYMPDTGIRNYDYGYSVGYEDGIYGEAEESEFEE